MSERNDPEVLRIAKAVADRTTVDWERLTTLDRGAARKIRHLRLVDEISAAYGRTREGGAGAAAALAPRLDGAPPCWGKLEIRDRIGAGGFSEVFRAHDPDLDCEVALKLLSPRIYENDDRARERFVDEARRLARVRHPNVLTVHGVEQHGGRIGLWADLLEGMTLEDWLDSQGPLSAQQAALVGIDVCRALAAVHAQGIVHRDVKTTNVFRETGGRIVLMDFGSSTEREPEASATGVQQLSGTPAYMPPELFEGRDSGRRVDVYALGVVLYRLVTGRYPVARGASPNRRTEVVPLRDRRPDVPAGFVRVVERALSADPEQRHAGVAEMELALVDCVGVGMPPAVARERAGAAWKRPAVLVPALAALLALALLVATLAPWGSFEVEATLFRAGGGVEERLRDGSRLVPGDGLFLEIEGSRPMHVYVLNQDATGDAVVLFPLPGLDQRNPVPGGRRVRLPGTLEGAGQRWSVTSAGGEEHLLVVAAREPLRDLERALADLPRSAPGVPVQLPDPGPLTRGLRGIAGLEPADAAGAGAGTPMGDALDRLSIRAGHTRDVWMWEIRLSNP